MTEQTAIANRPETGMARIKNYMLSPEVKERFSEMMGPGAIYYLNQVLITVSNNDDLQRCSPQSILVSAMRAASLRLSVDPVQGQAWIIPYSGKATFQLGYKGVYELAMRTNLYRFINVIDIYEGETLEENRMTGMHQITGKATSSKVIARMLYFQLLNGFEKTFVMTVEEIEDHARRYSPTYNSKRSPWNDQHERPKMERKTVLVNGLRRWGRFNQGDAEILEQIETEQGWTGDRFHELPDEDQITVIEPEKKDAPQILGELGFDAPTETAASQPEPAAEKPWTNEKVTLEMAKAEKSSEGALYWEMETKLLSDRFNGLVKALKANGLKPEEKEAKELKRDVIKAIMDYRAA